MRGILVWLGLVLLSAGCGSDSEGSGTGGTSSGGAAGSGGSGTGGAAGAAGATGAAFECLGKVKLPTTTDKTGELFGQVLDAVSNQPVGAGFTLKACTPSDVDCKSPAATGATDDAGELSLTLPFGANGFDGFGELTGTGYFPTLIFNSVPLIPDASTKYHFLVATEAAHGLIAQSAGVSPDPAKGHAVVWTHGCDGKLAAGVSLELDAGAEGTLAYLQGKAISTAAKQTDAGGIAYVFNAAPGSLGITARRTATGDVFGKVNIRMRAATAATVYFHPTP